MTLKTLMPLLRMLADGQFHTGRDLGLACGITRAAVWKRLQSLPILGVSLLTDKQRGYAIPGGLNLIDTSIIQSHLSITAKSLINRLIGFDEVDSTNQYLLQQGHTGDVCISEHQTAGRGRRGRVWRSGFGQNICLSVCWQYDQGLHILQGLSLAAGLWVAERVEAMGGPHLELKWPNDLWIHQQKVGGILIEVGGGLNEDCRVVLGLGLNLKSASLSEANIDQPWTSFQDHQFQPDRNYLYAQVISELLEGLNRFAQEGFAAAQTGWLARAALRGQPVKLQASGQEICGLFAGVDAQGALQISCDGKIQSIHAGEMSLRTNV